MKKKLLSILLSVCMVASVFSMTSVTALARSYSFTLSGDRFMSKWKNNNNPAGSYCKGDDVSFYVETVYHNIIIYVNGEKCNELSHGRNTTHWFTYNGTITVNENNVYITDVKPAIYKVGATEYKTTADLNTAIANGSIAQGSTITLTGEKPDGTIVLNGKDMTINGSIVLPDNGVLVSATNKARVNVIGTIPTTGNYNTANAPIYSEGFIYINGSLTTTGHVYQAKTVADFKAAAASLTDNISLNVSAEVAPKNGDEITIDAKEGEVGVTTYNSGTKLYETTIRNIYLTHVGNDLGLSIKANDTAVEALQNYTTVKYLSAVATAAGATATTKTLVANLIIACKYINDAGTGNKGAAINLSDAGLSWINSAKTEDIPTANPMSINATTESIKIGAAGLHVTDKLNVYVKLLPRNELVFVPGGTYVMAYIDNGDGYETIAVTDSMVYSDDGGNNGQWYSYINKLIPTQYDSDIKVELYTNLNALAQTLHYSVNTYCASMYSKNAALCTAIYNYGTAAEAYVAAQ